MVNPGQFKKLLYDYEVLWARYDIRDHYLNKIVQQIYENIGQLLSLIRLQLTLASSDEGTARESLDEPNKLIGQVMQQLRTLAKSFNPEKELLAKSGLIQTIEYELMLLGTGQVEHFITVKGVPGVLNTGTELIVFRMLQEMLNTVNAVYYEKPIEVKIIFEKKDVTFIIAYSGEPINWKQFNLQAGSDLSLTRLTLLERAELINATFQVNHNLSDRTHLSLIVPFKISVYE